MGSQYLLPLSAAGGFALTAALFAFVYYRGMALLQFYQQEEYNTERFLVWIIKRRAFDKKATLTILLTFIAWYFIGGINPVLFNPLFYILVFTALVIGAKSSYDAWKSAKKPLVQTPRAQRIFYAYMVLVGVYFAGILGQQQQIDIPLLTASFLGFFQAPPLFLSAANFILRPFEDRVNARYLGQAKAKLNKLSPVMVAITGSYGKTTTKHILAHILSADAPTLATPASVNTEMGVTRIIREELKEHHKYLIVEMGAYGPGSIKKLCQLTPPNLGIITAVGVAHFERFRTLERVFRSKFELAEDLKTRREKTLVNASDIPEELLKSYAATNPHLVLAGVEKAPFALDVALAKCSQDSEGLKLKLALKGRKEGLDFSVPLYGEHNCKNVMMAAAAALELGIAPETIKATLRTMPQIAHRLEVIQGVKGPTIIDDAYNSNPKGFESALKVLSEINKKGGRRILLTPGMIELGAAHDAEHKRLGGIAGKHVDIALVVGPRRMESFCDAFNASKEKGAQLRTFETQKDAEEWVKQNATNKDTILFENNLPDLYETFIEF